MEFGFSEAQATKAFSLLETLGIIKSLLLLTLRNFCKADVLLGTTGETSREQVGDCS